MKLQNNVGGQSQRKCKETKRERFSKSTVTTVQLQNEKEELNK